MKTFSITFMSAIFLFLVFACRHEQCTMPTPEEAEQIRNEVKAAAEPLMTGWAALDGQTALKSFSREMVACFDSLLLDYDTYEKSWAIYTGARDSIKITPIRKDYIILTREYVIDTWVGKVEEWMKSGQKITYNPVRYTNVFRKAGGEWKIIFAQSSGIPVTQPPVK
jgi:hypothetical protein